MNALNSKAATSRRHFDTVGSSTILTEFVGSQAGSAPRDWQTIVFRADRDTEVVFYDTEAAATAGHRRVVVKELQHESAWVAFARFFIVIGGLLGLIYIAAY